MSARDANNRLSRRIREAQPTYDRLAPFRPHGQERITIPPGNEQQTFCDSWPECQCDGDCNDAPRGLTEEQAVLLIVLFALILSGLGLIYLAVR